VSGCRVAPGVSDHRVVVAKGARIVRSHIMGPAIIGSGSVISDTYVGACTSVGPSCVLENAEIGYSIIMEGSRVRNVRRIDGSLIGKEADIADAAGVPCAHQLVLGDHSMVRIAS
jgi:glucose-1-phosphate thymidylyltransferase